MTKKFGSEMPEVLFVIDNDYEQRYYRSPETAVRGILGWSADHSTIHAYRHITQDADGQPADLNERIGEIRDAYQAWFDVNYNMNQTIIKAREKQAADEILAILRELG